jgi:endoglucanase
MKLAVALLAACCAAAAAEPVAWPERVVRGANIPCSASEADVEHYIKQWNGYAVRILINSITEKEPPYAVSDKQKERVFRCLDLCLSRGLITVFSPSASFGDNDRFFGSEEWLAAFTRFWQEVATRYKDKGPIVYDLVNEPWGGEARRRWNSYAKELTAAIRKIDNRHTIMVVPPEWGWANGFRYLEPTGDPNTVYSFHFYGPMDYTHQRNRGHMKTSDEQWRERVYPGPLQGEQWDRERFRKEVQLAAEWRDKHNVTMWCGEFGVARWARGADRWMKDWIDVLEQAKMGWAYYEYRGWQHMDMEMDPASRQPTPRAETGFSKLFQTYFAMPR